MFPPRILYYSCKIQTETHFVGDIEQEHEDATTICLNVGNGVHGVVWLLLGHCCGQLTGH